MTDSETKVLLESECGDSALFKGIFTSYLRYFIDNHPNLWDSKRNFYQKFLTNQTFSLWDHS
jgi:predicted alpha-1,6-mannanase (GH76 family)